MRSPLIVLASLACSFTLGACLPCMDCGECGIRGIAANDFIAVDTLGYDEMGRPSARVALTEAGACGGDLTASLRIVEGDDGTIGVQAPEAYAGAIVPTSTSSSSARFELTDRDWIILQPAPEFGSPTRTIFAGPEGMPTQIDCESIAAVMTCAVAP